MRPDEVFWLGIAARVPVPAPVKAGLHSIEVVAGGPRYINLHVTFEDETLAPLLVPLEPVGRNRYRRLFSLADKALSAWLEVVPVDAASDAVEIKFTPARWAEVAAMAGRAALRHARSPRTLIAKARQVAGGRAREPRVYGACRGAGLGSGSLSRMATDLRDGG